MAQELRLYEDGVEACPASTIVMTNVGVVLWIAVGAYLGYLLHPALGWGYLALAVLMVGLVLRKLVCPNCYYYGKWCGAGWGKLSALTFKKGELAAFADCTGARIAPAAWGSLALIPLVAGAAVLAVSPEQRTLAGPLLAAFFLYSLGQGSFIRKRTCAACKMRLVCTGSAAKEEQ